MKVKVYRVVSKKNPNIAYYMVDAPSKKNCQMVWSKPL